MADNDKSENRIQRFKAYASKINLQDPSLDNPYIYIDTLEQDLPSYYAGVVRELEKQRDLLIEQFNAENKIAFLKVAADRARANELALLHAYLPESEYTKLANGTLNYAAIQRKINELLAHSGKLAANIAYEQSLIDKNKTGHIYSYTQASGAYIQTALGFLEDKKSRTIKGEEANSLSSAVNYVLARELRAKLPENFSNEDVAVLAGSVTSIIMPELLQQNQDDLKIKSGKRFSITKVRKAISANDTARHYLNTKSYLKEIEKEIAYIQSGFTRIDDGEQHVKDIKQTYKDIENEIVLQEKRKYSAKKNTGRVNKLKTKVQMDTNPNFQNETSELVYNMIVGGIGNKTDVRTVIRYGALTASARRMAQNLGSDITREDGKRLANLQNKLIDEYTALAKEVEKSREKLQNLSEIFVLNSSVKDYFGAYESGGKTFSGFATNSAMKVNKLIDSLSTFDGAITSGVDYDILANMILNTGKQAVGDFNKPYLARYLSLFVVAMLFDESLILFKDFAQQFENQVKVIELFPVNGGLYATASYLLYQLYQQMSDAVNNLDAPENFASVHISGQIDLHAKLQEMNQQSIHGIDRWNTVYIAQRDAVNIRFHLLKNFADFLNDLSSN